jgi:imidazole glycerol-phosphate synthase subunit HisH
MIGIVDYGLGNVQAFANVFKSLDVSFVMVKSESMLERVTKLILPGVGAFDYAMLRLAESGMKSPLDQIATQQKVPILGVCVGMQMLGRSSEEGELPGLGWLDGGVKRFGKRPDGRPLSVPHMGWNDVVPTRGSLLFKGLESGARFYFLHSYYMRCGKSEDIIATTDYGGQFACAVNSGSIYGVQFHPEKSHHYGIRLLKNFADL